MTLIGCVFERSKADSSSRHAGQVYNCEAVVRGGHVTRNSLYESAVIKVRHLNGWAQIGRISMVWGHQVGKSGVGVFYEDGQAAHATLTDGSEVWLSSQRSQSFSGTHAASVNADRHFRVGFGSPKTLDQVVDEYVTPLVNLLTLVVDAPSSLISLQLQPWSRRRVTLRGQYQVGYKVPLLDSAEYSLAHLATQVIRYDDFDFAKQLPAWFDASAKLRGIHGLLFGLRQATDMPVHNRYQNSITAVEGLHRATHVSRRMEFSLNNQEGRAWLATLPEGERSLVKARFSQYMNDPSLGDRLTELVSKAGVAFSWVVTNPQKWAALVKNTRNDVTHPGEKPRVEISSSQMSVLAESVALLASISFLVDLGFTPVDLQPKLERSVRLKILAQDMRTLLPKLYA